MKKYLSKEQVMPVLAVLLAVLIVTGASYALFTVVKVGTKSNEIHAGTLHLKFTDPSSNSINLEGAIPTTDTTGMSGTAYTFTLENTGTLPVYYRLKIEENEDLYTTHGDTGKIFEDDKLKIGLIKNGATKYLFYHRQDLDTGVLQPGEKNTYTARIWINYHAGNEVKGNHFHGTFLAEGYQESFETTTEESYFTFDASTGTITGYHNDGPKAVMIPESIEGTAVLKIAPSAFASKQLTSVVLPSKLTYISSQAFRDNQLTTVTIPKSVTKVEYQAFDNNALTSVKMYATTSFDPASFGWASGYDDNNITYLTEQ